MKLFLKYIIYGNGFETSLCLAILCNSDAKRANPYFRFSDNHLANGSAKGIILIIGKKIPVKE